MKQQKKPLKTNATIVDTVADVQTADPIADRLDKIIELLVKIEANTQNLPKPGFDISKLVRD
jgi:hypothetical protein